MGSCVVGVPNWLQQEVGRLSSEYFTREWLVRSWDLRKRHLEAGEGQGAPSQSRKVGRLWLGGRWHHLGLQRESHLRGDDEVKV